MKSHQKTTSILSPLLFLFLLPQSSSANSDYATLVYKLCSNQKYTDSTGTFSETLSSLLATLVSQSSYFKFFKTSVSDIDQILTLSGLYQCRGDLNLPECFDCINSLRFMSYRFCSQSTSALIQLSGCYLKFSTKNYDGVYESSDQVLYNTCHGEKPAITELDQSREAAFLALEREFVMGVDGFYRNQYGPVYLMVQCEGDLGERECSKCVSDAVQSAETECVGSDSGQVYFDKCFLGFGCYPNSFPGDSYRDVIDNGNTGRTVAIVVGVGAALFFAFMFVMCVKSMKKKT
ncbi:Gnk2-homologous domain [Dillenia turbinata]|uniref:Gnk2-homologous domain n=1 Tax=Dillenia turbinata TaxID=194707 RepID=A0AAN8YW71_9MAGN